MDITLSGLYEGTDARDYVILQDRAERQRDHMLVHVRVMRQRDSDIRSGTLLVPDAAFEQCGPTDADRSSAISRALIFWLQSRPAILTFALRVNAVNGRVELEAMKQSV